MIPLRHRLLRAALLPVPLAAVGLLLATHHLGTASAAVEPSLAVLRLPLDLATGGSGVLALAATALAWRWSHLATATDRPALRSVRALRHLQVGVVALGVYAATCTTGMGAVLDERGLGMPGVWLLALLLEAGLVAVLVAAGHAARQAGQEVADDQRTGRLPQPR